MNATQRTIVVWILIIAAVILHFAFIGYEDPHAGAWNPQTRMLEGRSAELFWCFYTTNSFWDQKVLAIGAGLIAPAILIGSALFVWAGAPPAKTSQR